MSRPRLTIGTYGDIATRVKPNGRFVARALYRDWDGKSRAVQCTSTTAKAAERALKAKLAERTLFQASCIALTADSPFPDLVAYWLEDLDLEGRISIVTRQLYERNMRGLVLPALENLTLREIGVQRCDQLLKHLAKKSYNRARQARTVLRLALGLAVRHEVLPRNPMDYVSRLHRPPKDPDALTADEVNAIRQAVAWWEAGRDVSGPKPDGQLSAIIEVMLGTSARIGEALALRRCDIDITSPSPTIRIAGTIVSPKGRGTYRQDHPKTHKSNRIVSVPSYTSEAVRKRLPKLKSKSPDALLFCTREGNPITTSSARRQLRHVLKLAELPHVSPHKFRRTVATAITEDADIELAAEMLGHTDKKYTFQHYVRRNQMVNPTTAAILEAAFAKKG